MGLNLFRAAFCALPHRDRSVHRNAGAGEGNRTLVVSLEGFCSTIELHPPWYYLPDARFPRELRPLRAATLTLVTRARRKIDGGGGRIRTFEG